MPRAKKAQGNQHNSRHENGIVAPGKRVTKQKSNGHLNGSAETSAPATAPPLPTASAHTAPAIPESHVNGAPTGPKEPFDQSGGLANGSTDLVEVSKNVSTGVYQDGEAQEPRHRKVEAHTARSPLLPRDGILNLALTILQACPLGDTIAILLVLMWLPSTLLTVTNGLFAVITFMPPTVPLPSFPPTFNDLFVGSGNTPSLATIFLTDVIGLVLWLVIWTPMQTLAIELAQAVVATTLGGGRSGKKQGSDSTIFCMGLVAVNHVARHDWLPQQVFGLDWSAILSTIPFVSRNAHSFPLDFNTHGYMEAPSPAGWLRILIALHILIQGLVHVARRWYQQREYAQTVSNHRRPDPESIPGTLNRSNNVLAGDVGTQPPTPTSPDGLIKSTLPRDVREKVSTGKKRRRQGALVRSQQPLWAAFAATKLTVLREFEHSQALKEVASSGATDITDLGSAQFELEGGHAWISEVKSESFCIETSLASTSEHLISENEDDSLSRPFRVRLNDMEWVSVNFEKGPSEIGSERWSCEVFGLSPVSSYRCRLIRNEDDIDVYSATITTPPPQIDEKERSTPSEVSRQTYRPLIPESPTTTLQKSIAAAEASLGEAQARQKRAKKDGKTAAANLKRDIDVFNSKINKLASEDKAHANRNMQWNQLTRQAEEALADISSEIDSLGNVPTEDLKQSKEKAATWDELKKAQDVAREDLNRAKEEAQKERTSVQNEATTSQQKRERLVARKAKLHDQHERLEAAAAHGIGEIQRKNSEQAAKDLERARIEQSFAEQVQSLMRAVQETRFFTQRIWNQQQSVEAAFHQHQMMENVPPPEIERPLTPEGDLPGTNPQNASNSGFRAPAFGSPDNPALGLRSHSGSLRHGDTRPRSTSGLSASSVYADFDDQDPAPPMPARAVEVIRERGQMHSRNSGHGSGSSGSQRDPASPIGGHGVQISPVGKKGQVWNS